MKTIAKIIGLLILGVSCFGVGAWTCSAINRYVGEQTDWKFLAAVLVPSAFFAVSVWCAMTLGRMFFEGRRRARITRAGLIAGYPRHEITDYFEKKAKAIKSTSGKSS